MALHGADVVLLIDTARFDVALLGPNDGKFFNIVIRRGDGDSLDHGLFHRLLLKLQVDVVGRHVVAFRGLLVELVDSLVSGLAGGGCAVKIKYMIATANVEIEALGDQFDVFIQLAAEGRQAARVDRL